MLINKGMYSDESLMSILGVLTQRSAEALGAVQRVSRLDDARRFWHLPRIVEYPWAFQQIKSKAEKILDVGSNVQFWVALDHLGYDVTIHHTQHDLDHMGACTTGVGWVTAANYLRDRKFKAICGLPQDLEFLKDAQFDTIMNLSVMEHVPADQFEPWLDAFWRLLKPGGKMICTCDWPYEKKVGEEAKGRGSSWFVNHDWMPFIKRSGAILSEAEGVPWANGHVPEVGPDHLSMEISLDHPPMDPPNIIKIAVYGFVLHKP